MSFPPLPAAIDEVDVCDWGAFEPYFAELQKRPLTRNNVRQWLEDWSALERFLWEAFSWTYIQKSLDTTDKAREQAFLDILHNVYPEAQKASQALKERLLALEITPEEMPDMALALRNMHSEAAMFRAENIPLKTKLAELDNEYDKLTGGLKAVWEGEEKNLSQLAVFLKERNRAVRQRAWETIAGLWLSIRPALDDIYTEMLKLRQRVAANADFPDYRAYAFQENQRFDYTPEDCFIFHEAIETVVVPAVRRILARKRERLGYEVLRPWDWIPERGILVQTGNGRPLQPYNGQDDLVRHTRHIFNQLDPELGRYYAIMAEENLLDLDTRPGKALGGYCSSLPWRKRPFIFMNGVGLHDDVQTMLHESGHAFHDFAAYTQPLVWQTKPPMEFAEVASMSMELLAAPYLTQENGGFYTPAEAARARIEHLEGIIVFLPYMAVVDAFQHWVYTHPDEAMTPANRDAAWDNLWRRFIPDVNWDGFAEARMTGWQRKPHIFGSPFYYIEYGMAQVGALQVWRNSLADRAGALAAYRYALSLGGTQTLPALFTAVGAEFRFDTTMLTSLVHLVEETIAQLEREAGLTV